MSMYYSSMFCASSSDKSLISLALELVSSSLSRNASSVAYFRMYSSGFIDRCVGGRGRHVEGRPGGWRGGTKGGNMTNWYYVVALAAGNH